MTEEKLGAVDLILKKMDELYRRGCEMRHVSINYGQDVEMEIKADKRWSQFILLQEGVESPPIVFFGVVSCTNLMLPADQIEIGYRAVDKLR